MTPTRSVLIRTREKLINERNYWKDKYNKLVVSTTLSNISLQKHVATIVYQQISLIGSSPILVGGAPRDWYFGREASDLDFFFVPSMCIAIDRQLSILGVTFVKNTGTPEHHLCKQMPGPLKIWKGMFGTLKIQLVEIASKEIMNIAVDELHLSISKICWSPEVGFQMHEDFNKTLETKIICGKNGYDLDSPYAQKVLDKYKHLGYTLGESS